MVETIGPIEVKDLTGQKAFRLDSVPAQEKVDEVVKRLLTSMRMPATDSLGREISYTARLEREARFVGGQERVGDALEPHDTLRLLPSIEAGQV